VGYGRRDCFTGREQEYNVWHGQKNAPLFEHRARRSGECSSRRAVVFVCGEASRMAPEVRQDFVEVFRQRTGTRVADGQAWLTGLAASPRYLKGIWASGT
jgi:hypothetical protein